MRQMNRFGMGRSDAGLTLIELMVALVMGLILLGGLATVFIANKQTYKHQDVLARLQENGRFALALLERDIRSAGSGINIDASLAKNNVSKLGVKSTDSECGSASASPFGGILEGFEGSDTTRIATLGLPSDYVPLSNSDVIRMTTGMELGVEILKDPGNPGASNPAARLDVSNCGVVKKINETDPGTVFTVVNSDGTSYSVFQLTDVSACDGEGDGNILIRKNNEISGVGVWNCDFVLEVDFTGGYLVGTSSTIYFIAYSRDGSGNLRRDALGNPIPALHRAVDRGSVEELVEGVESMRLMFGTGANAIAEQYERPNAIWSRGDAEWEKVRSVRLQLLLHSIEPKALTAANPTNFAPKDFYSPTTDSGDAGWTATPPADGRWRQVYGTTIAVRSRLP